MQKLRIEGLEVESFATVDVAPVARGTVQANDASGAPCNLTYNGCPTQYCATVPLLCETRFAPQCTGTTCTG
jgi:hypothetical protein